MTAQHWTFPLIGLPWRQGASGPDAYDCWGLVRHAVASQLGHLLPPINVGAADNIGAIGEAARGGGWKQVVGPMQAQDIVLMQGPRGRHVGFAVAVSTTPVAVLRVLHSNGFIGPRGPQGGVVLQPLGEVACNGYSQFDLWRHQP